MTAVAVSLTEAKRFLGISASTHDTLLQELLDHSEELLLAECNRRERPFAASQNAITEVHDGTGSSLLTLKYPISSISGNVRLGRDTSDYDEELDSADVDEIVYAAGKRSVERTDGGIFGEAGSPRYVRVTYDAQEDKPEIAKLAIKRMVAFLFRQLGSEGATRETFDGHSIEFAETDPLWKLAVKTLGESRV